MMNEKENDNFDSVTAHKLWKKHILKGIRLYYLCSVLVAFPSKEGQKRFFRFKLTSR